MIYKYLFVRFSQIILFFICYYSIKLTDICDCFLGYYIASDVALFIPGGSILFFITEKKRISGILAIILLTRIVDVLIVYKLTSFFDVTNSILISKLLVFALEGMLFPMVIKDKNQLLFRFFSNYPLSAVIRLKWEFRRLIFKLSHKLGLNSGLIQNQLITTTYFFRDIDDYEKKLVDYYNLNKSKLNILVIGCSSGQEVYSIALLCKKHHIAVEIKGIDLSEKAIQIAKNGVFDINKEADYIRRTGDTKALEEFERNRIHFIKTANEEEYKINSEIVNVVQFQCEDATNLDDNEKFDFVFMRKMIYYVPKNIRPKIVLNAVNALKHKENLILDKSSFIKVGKLYKQAILNYE